MIWTRSSWRKRPKGWLVRAVEREPGLPHHLKTKQRTLRTPPSRQQRDEQELPLASLTGRAKEKENLTQMENTIKGF